MKSQPSSDKTTKRIILHNLNPKQKEALKMGGAALFGALGPQGLLALIGRIGPNNEPMLPKPSNEIPQENHTETVIVHCEAPFAENIDNSMSFPQAFRTAREEVGPGGFFEWNGHTYNTYTAEEWENLGEEGRADFANALHQNIDFNTIEAVEPESLPANTAGNTPVKPEEEVTAQETPQQEVPAPHVAEEATSPATEGNESQNPAEENQAEELFVLEEDVPDTPLSEMTEPAIQESVADSPLSEAPQATFTSQETESPDAAIEIQEGVIVLDANFDEIPEAIFIDADLDGTVDAIVLDQNADGLPDSYLIDLDEDGVIESMIVDEDQDDIQGDEEVIPLAEDEVISITLDEVDEAFSNSEEDLILDDEHEIEEDLPDLDDDADVSDLV